MLSEVKMQAAAGASLATLGAPADCIRNSLYGILCVSGAYQGPLVVPFYGILSPSFFMNQAYNDKLPKHYTHQISYIKNLQSKTRFQILLKLEIHVAFIPTHRRRYSTSKETLCLRCSVVMHGMSCISWHEYLETGWASSCRNIQISQIDRMAIVDTIPTLNLWTSDSVDADRNVTSIGMFAFSEHKSLCIIAISCLAVLFSRQYSRVFRVAHCGPQVFSIAPNRICSYIE